MTALAWPERITILFVVLLAPAALFLALVGTAATFPFWIGASLGMWFVLCEYFALPLWVGLRLLDLAANGPAIRRARRAAAMYGTGPVIDGHLDR